MLAVGGETPFSKNLRPPASCPSRPAMMLMSCDRKGALRGGRRPGAIRASAPCLVGDAFAGPGGCHRHPRKVALGFPICCQVCVIRASACRRETTIGS